MEKSSVRVGMILIANVQASKEYTYTKLGACIRVTQIRPTGIFKGKVLPVKNDPSHPANEVIVEEFVFEAKFFSPVSATVR
jgi:hypothetical protein